MSLSSYVLRRLLYSIPTLIGVTFLVFVIFNLIAGDPTAVLLGERATVQQMADLRHQLGLDRPLYIQYWDILQSMFTFDFGRSWVSHQLIATMIKKGGLVSLTLSVPGFVISTVLSVLIALVAAFFRGRLIDKGLVVACVMLKSISALTYILFGQWFFAYNLGWFKINGYENGFPYFIPYILLPTLIWVVLTLGPDVRFYRTVLLDEFYKDYVRTAKAKGLSIATIMFSHVLPNAFIPILTNIVVQIPFLILGAFLLENFFSIPGLGGITLNAIHYADFPVIKAMTILSALFFIFFNILTDVLYRVVDKRIQLS